MLKWKALGAQGYKRGDIIVNKGKGRWIIANPETWDILFHLDYAEQDEPWSAALTRIDLLHPPAPWAYAPSTAHASGIWSAEVNGVRWSVVPVDPSQPPTVTSWAVERGTEEKSERVSTREWAVPHLAREWAQVRFDRSGLSLRGPRPRAGAPATCRLDVRVTEQERAELAALSQTLGCGYGPLVRAAVRLVRAGIASGALRVERRPGGRGDVELHLN